jgi:hypothetical protein
MKMIVDGQLDIGNITESINLYSIDRYDMMHTDGQFFIYLFLCF